MKYIFFFCDLLEMKSTRSNKRMRGKIRITRIYFPTFQEEITINFNEPGKNLSDLQCNNVLRMKYHIDYIENQIMNQDKQDRRDKNEKEDETEKVEEENEEDGKKEDSFTIFNIDESEDDKYFIPEYEEIFDFDF